MDGANRKGRIEEMLGNSSAKKSYATGKVLAPCIAALIVFLAMPAGAQAQKKQKDQAINPNATMPPIPLSVPDQLDKEVSEMLGAFQLGDVERMHNYYAENASFVSGGYAPPVLGWPTYAAQYEKERASFQAMQIVRRNTTVFHSGDVAWMCYQWELSAMYLGKPYDAKGQTTLVFVKSGDTWLIVHNHTSQVCPNEAGIREQITPSTTAPATPQH
jgi:ketosteroid isomerase-like protein